MKTDDMVRRENNINIQIYGTNKCCNTNNTTVNKDVLIKKYKERIIKKIQIV